MLFSPAVTTQFISNLERGVTPLPPAHIPTLCKALQVPEEEILGLLEREYAAKLSGRLGKEPGMGSANGPAGGSSLAVDQRDLAFMRAIYEAYRSADAKTQSAFETVCESILKLSRQRRGGDPSGTSVSGLESKPVHE